MIDHEDVRRSVGAAAGRIEAARNAKRDANRSEIDAAHKKWRDLVDQAQRAREDYERLSKLAHAPVEALAVISAAKKKHPELLFFRHDNMEPMCCTATGLALMEGDETYGDPEYGAVLAAAVNLVVKQVELEDHAS